MSAVRMLLFNLSQDPWLGVCVHARAHVSCLTEDSTWKGVQSGRVKQPEHVTSKIQENCFSLSSRQSLPSHEIYRLSNPTNTTISSPSDVTTQKLFFFFFNLILKATHFSLVALKCLIKSSTQVPHPRETGGGDTFLKERRKRFGLVFTRRTRVDVQHCLVPLPQKPMP